MSERLRLERMGPGGAVARVMLSRPEVHNAFDASLIADLRAAFAALGNEEPTSLRAVVLAGDGPSFCAGADIAWMRAALTLDTEANEQDAMAMADMFETIDTCPVPVIARVQGAALGGGMGLCAVSDLVIAESGARFGFTETRLGILPAVIAPFVIAKIGETQCPRAVPGRTAVRRVPSPADRPRPRGRRRRGGARRSDRDRVADLLAAGPDGRSRREGDRPRGARPAARLVEVAHGPGHRPPAPDAPRRRRGSGRSTRSGRRLGSARGAL